MFPYCTYNTLHMYRCGLHATYYDYPNDSVHIANRICRLWEDAFMVQLLQSQDVPSVRLPAGSKMACQTKDTNITMRPFSCHNDLIKDTFRKHVRNTILKALNNGQLVLPDGMRPQQVQNLINKLGRKKWNVRICEKYQIKGQDCFEDSNDHSELCPICGKRLVMTSILKPTGMIPDPGAPPLLMPYLKEAA